MSIIQKVVVLELMEKERLCHVTPLCQSNINQSYITENDLRTGKVKFYVSNVSVIQTVVVLEHVER